MLNKDGKAEKSEQSGLVSVSGVFLEHTSFLKRFLAKFLRNEQDIEDVAQEAFLKAYSAEQDRGGIEQPKAFLFSIAKNLALNELSRKSRQMTDYIEECHPDFELGSSESVEGEIEAGESIGLYCEAVANLPVKCRRVYLLRKIHGLSHKEIAARLSISRSAVEKHISSGSLSCRDYMQRKRGEYTEQNQKHRGHTQNSMRDKLNG